MFFFSISLSLPPLFPPSKLRKEAREATIKVTIACQKETATTLEKQKETHQLTMQKMESQHAQQLKTLTLETERKVRWSGSCRRRHLTDHY